MFKNIIKTKNELRSIISGPSEMVMAKEIDFLDAHCQALIVRSPFILLATANQAGRCDVSPKGDAPGFVQVLDDKHLAIPDRPGNARLDSVENILENPHIGLLFVIPGTRETLRINGKAVIIRRLADQTFLVLHPPDLDICAGPLTTDIAEWPGVDFGLEHDERGPDWSC